jgi:hypothetical protein
MFHGNSGYANVSQCYGILTFPVLLDVYCVLKVSVPKQREMLELRLTWLKLHRKGHMLSITVGEDILVTSS